MNRILKTALCIAAISAKLLSVSTTAAGTGGSTRTSTVRRPYDLARSIGAGVFNSVPVATIAQQMKATGISLIRTTANNAAAVTFIQQLRDACAAIGVSLRVNVFIVGYVNDPNATELAQQVFLQQVYNLGVLASVEGPNEMNNLGVGNGTLAPNTNYGVGSPTGPQFYAWANIYGPWVHANLPGVQVYSPTVINEPTGIAADASNVSAIVDRGAFHPYLVTGNQPSNVLGYRHTQGQAIMGDPNGPMVGTEWGYSNWTTTQSGYIADETTGAKLNVNEIFALIGMNVTPEIIYDLSGTDNAGPNDAEAHFGMYDDNGNPKLTATAIGRLTALCVYDNGSGTPGALAATASGGANVLSFPDAVGGGVIAVWNETQVWDGSNPVTPTAVASNVNWGTSLHYAVTDLITGAVTSGVGTNVIVNLTGYAFLIKLTTS